MGVFTQLILLPLAPVRFTVWVSEKVAEQVDREQGSPEAHMRQLREIDEKRRSGELTQEQAADAETKIIEQYTSSVAPIKRPEGTSG
jgi:hypothetical protein